MKQKKVEKKSPTSLKASEVESFIELLQHPLREVVVLLRTIILASDKDLTEQVKWNAPSFCYDGDDRITMNLSKKDCVLIIWHRGAKSRDRKNGGPLFEDGSGLLEWLSPDRAVTKFYSKGEVTKRKSALTELVKAWIKATKT